MPGHKLSTAAAGPEGAPIVITPRQLTWMKEHFPRHYQAAIGAIEGGKAVVVLEAPGCKV